MTGPAMDAHPRRGGVGRAAVRYAAAAALSAAGLLAAAVISTRLDTYTLLPGVMAIAAAAWLGGGGPGLAATAITALGFAVAVIPPNTVAGAPSAGDAFRLVLYAGAGVAISAFSRALRRARDHAEARAAEAARHAEESRASVAAVEAAAEALRVSEAQYRTLVDSVRDYAIFRLDPDGRVASWNAGAAAIYGYAADEIVGRHYTTFLPTEAGAAASPGAELAAAAAADGRAEDEGWRVRRDGARFWANVVTTAVRDDAGRLTGFTKITRDLTERRAAEEARRASEARLAGIIDSAMDAILTTDAEQRVVLANAAAERVFGYPASDLVGRPLDALIPERFRGAHGEHVRRFGDTGTTTRAMGPPGSLAHIGLLGRRADGSEFPIEASISQLATPAGRFYTVILRDVTERQGAEAALRASEERARLALDAAQLGTFEWDVPAPGAQDPPAGHRWDARARELYGFAPDEPVTLDRLDARIHPDDRAGARAAFERVAAEAVPAGGTARLESAYRVVLPGGAVRTLEVRGRLTFAGRGSARRPARLVGTVLDVTERIAAAAALRAQYELLNAILAATDDLVFAKDRDGRYVVMNPAGARLHGRPADAIVGCTDEEIFPPALAAELRANDARVLAAGSTLRFEESTVVDGERRVYQSSKGVYRDADGRPAGVVGVSTDVTDRVRAEAALRDANAELAQTTYTIAHDLRSPLRGMHGYASLLAREYGPCLDARGQGYVERVRANAVRMGQLVDGVLALTKLGRAELRAEPVDVSALARAAVDDLVRAEPDRRVEVRVADGLTAFGDPRLLALAVQNLVANAWKFTRDRDPATIDVARADDGGGPALTVVVRDNGVGFDPEFAGQLFRPFHRLHTDAEFEGTGIGLATVRRVVERHGGRAWAEATVGRGAAVYITVPAPPAPGATAPAAPWRPTP